MPGFDKYVGLVGREVTAELVNQLVRYQRGRPVPILTLYGAGGVGKTAVIEHVERRYDRNVPLARVDFDEPRSKSAWDVLDTMFEQLSSDFQQQFGHLWLPRFELARTIRAMVIGVADEESDGGAVDPGRARSRRKAVRMLLAKRLTHVETMVRTVGDVAESVPTAGFAVRLLQPVLRLLTVWAMAAPRWLRWLIAGPRNAAALRWFEDAAAAQFDDLAANARIDDVVLHIQTRFGTRVRAEVSSGRWQRLAMSAMLADLRGAYRFRRTRRVNCVLLLDDADLLAPDRAERIAVQDRPTEPDSEPDFLDLLSGALAEQPGVPLLVVATKQSGAAPTAAVEPVDPQEDFAEQARRRYQRWRANLENTDEPDRAQLPVQLNSFDLACTRRFFVERDRGGGTTMLTEQQIRELHYVAHGHPLALELASDRLDWGFRRERQVPAVRATFDMRVPAGLRGADVDDTVRSYLLLRLLQRFRNNSDEGGEAVEQIEIRKRTVELFARLAAPTRLDEPVVDLLTRDRLPGSVRRIKERLDMLSFVRQGQDEAGVGRTWTLDPLLRDLLAVELLRHGGGPGHSHDEVHTMLAEHYEYREQDSAARLHADYHLLALGQVGGVAEHFAMRAEAGDRSWQRDLVEVLALAPIVRAEQSTRMLNRLRARTRAESVTGNVAAFADLIRALQALCSCTSTAAWSDKLFHHVDQVQGQLHGASTMDFRRWDPAFVRMRTVPDHGSLPESSRALVKFAYPRVWPPRGSLRWGAALIVITTALTYGGVYLTHRVQHCDETGFFEFGAVWRTLTHDPVGLVNQGGECIGLAKTASAFSEQPGAADNPDVQEVRRLSELIQQENDEVDAHRDDYSQPPAKVVVAAMLSNPDRADKLALSAGINELRGALLAQRKWNKFDTAELPPAFPVQLMLANFGGDSAFADKVAPEVTRAAQADPSIIGVTGLGQTRTATERAVEQLGAESEHPLPMVGSAISGTGFTGKPYFFRVPPTNREQAALGVRFGLENFPEHKPYLLHGANDQYGIDLASAQSRELHAHDVPDARSHQYRTDGGSRNVDDRVDEICLDARNSGKPPLIFYSGRANELPTLLAKLKQSKCGEHAQVIGTDDLSQLATSGWRPLETLGSYAFDHLHFTSFAGAGPDFQNGVPGNPEQVCRQVLKAAYSPQRCDFYVKYAETGRESPDLFGPEPNGHSVIAFDAVDLLLGAARGHNTPPGHPFDDLRELISHVGNGEYPAVSGGLRFVQRDPGLPEAGGDPLDKFMVVQRIVHTGEGKPPHMEVVDSIGTP